MALVLPTTKELALQVVNDIESRIGETIPFLPKAVFRVMANAFAAVFMILYKFAGWQFLQLFVKTAGAESLAKWGELVNIFRNPGQAAQLQINIIGDNGEIILTGTRFTNLTTGIVYILNSDVTIVGGIGAGVVTALTVGAIGNMFPGQQINFVSPQPNVNRVSIVTGTLIQGVNQEALEAYRTRVDNRFKKVPQGGAYADYEAWSLEVPTIDGAFPYSGDQEGTVVVYVRSSVSPNGVPTSAELDQVLTSINQADRRPVTAQVFVTSVNLIGFDVTITNLNPDTPETRENINIALTQYFKSREPFIDGLSIQNQGTITAAEVISIIQTAVQLDNATFDIASLALASDPVTAINNYILGQGQVAILDDVAYV